MKLLDVLRLDHYTQLIGLMHEFWATEVLCEAKGCEVARRRWLAIRGVW
jgi:hypothetical protein